MVLLTVITNLCSGLNTKITPAILGDTVAEAVRVHRSKCGEITVRKTGKYEYEAQSQSKDTRQYRIAYVLGKWCCSCKDFAHTCRACKHIAAMKKIFDASPPPLAHYRGYQPIYEW